MEVYIQPSTWDGPESKWPVSKLLVNVMNKLGDNVVPASECMKEENSQCLSFTPVVSLAC